MIQAMALDEVIHLCYIKLAFEMVLFSTNLISKETNKRNAIAFYKKFPRIYLSYSIWVVAFRYILRHGIKSRYSVSFPISSGPPQQPT